MNKLSKEARVFKPLDNQSSATSCKRSRSEVDTETPPFPERDGILRRPKLQIDPDNLPELNPVFNALEVDLGCQREMRWQEVEYQPDSDYFARQINLKPRMRAVLLDWMFEVSQEYGLKRDSVYFAINFVDRYLSKCVVERSSLQLIGVTALWMGSKMEEMMPPPIQDFSLATDGCCSVEDMVAMERKITCCFGWRLMPCTAYSFASCFLQRLIVNRLTMTQQQNERLLRQAEKSWMMTTVVPHVQLNRVMELLDAAMLDSDSLCFLPSVLAATAVLSLVLRDPASSFSARDVECATQIPLSELDTCMEWFTYVLELTPAAQAMPKPHVLQYTPSHELHMIQRHNRDALALHRAQEQRRNFKRSTPAQRSCDVLKQRLAGNNDLITVAAANETPEDEELATIERKRSWASTLLGRHSPASVSSISPSTISLASGDRAFSPMTGLAMDLANTGM